MNKQFIKKVIKASAGTGKTYRLSLEYINILLKWRPYKVSFDEILVITFTKKATAEIRDSIFSHLEKITNPDENNKERIELLNSYNEIFGDGTTNEKVLTEDEVLYLTGIKEEMLVNKHKLGVSTIDSFIDKIFRGVIAPYLGLGDFKVNSQVNKKYLPQIYDELLKKGKESAEALEIFGAKGAKNIERFDSFIEEIIENRWLFYMIEQKGGIETSGYDKKATLRAYRKDFKRVLNKFIGCLKKDGKGEAIASGIIDKSFLKVIDGSLNAIVAIENLMSDISSDDFPLEDFLKLNWKVLSKDLYFWNGNKCFKKKDFKERREDLKSDYFNVVALISEYFYYELLKVEEKNIVDLSKQIFEIYDEIKFREKILTHNDVSYYTLSSLYDEGLSLIDLVNGYVDNQFYEYLTTRTRFILIDEYQDTSLLQYRVLLPIMKELVSGDGSKPYGGIVVVGDEKQAIYGWRGGVRELLHDMSDIFNIEEKSRQSLTSSYRSSEFIMSNINKLFDNPQFKKLEAEGLKWDYNAVESKTAEKGGRFNVAFFNNSKSEKGSAEESNPYKNFVEKIVKVALDEHKIDPSKTAILARRNSDLKEIGYELDAVGINYLLESSLSILDHPVIKPLHYLLKYLADNDVVALLDFLRSDYSLVTAEELQEITEVYRLSKGGEKSFEELLSENCQKIKQLNKALEIEGCKCHKSIVELLVDILADFNVSKIFESDQYAKIIHQFLEVASKFEGDNRTEYDKSITGFLEYLDDHKEDDELKQGSLQGTDSLQLMTFHKSKGLQFETVFIYLPPERGGSIDTLTTLYRFDREYLNLEEYVVCYNYTDILKTFDRGGLYGINELKKRVEELNTYYVAATRAKTNLYLFLNYEKKGGIDDYFIDLDKTFSDSEEGETSTPKQLPDQISTLKLLHFAVYKLRIGWKKIGVNSPRLTVYEDSKTLTEKKREEGSKSKGAYESQPFKEYLRYDRKVGLEPLEKYESRYSSLQNYLANQQNTVGNISHFYLSWIKYATEGERTLARDKTVASFGNSVRLDVIEKTIGYCDKFIKEQSRLFDERWTKVFNELPVFNEQGEEFRIDRLMVDENKRQIWIVDYKTGGISKEGQVEDYKSIIANLPYVKNNDYEIKADFITI